MFRLFQQPASVPILGPRLGPRGNGSLPTIATRIGLYRTGSVSNKCVFSGFQLKLVVSVALSFGQTFSVLGLPPLGYVRHIARLSRLSNQDLNIRRRSRMSFRRNALRTHSSATGSNLDRFAAILAI
jgi:hypothetical protein